MKLYFIQSLKSLNLILSDYIVDKILFFWDYLLNENLKINLISRSGLEEPRFTAHVVDSLTGLLFEWPDNLNLVDLGSGGGFPAIPLKLARPGWSATLVESTAKKADFLVRAADLLSIEDLAVVNVFLKPSSPWPGPVFDLATTRGLASLHKTVPLVSSVLRPGGRFLAYKGPGGPKELSDARDLLRQYKLNLIGSKELLLPVLNSPRLLYLFEKS